MSRSIWRLQPWASVRAKIQTSGARQAAGLVLALVAVFWPVGPSQAAVIATLQEVGNDLHITTDGGSINTAALGPFGLPFGTTADRPLLDPVREVVNIGVAGSPADLYLGEVSSPGPFGTTNGGDADFAMGPGFAFQYNPAGLFPNQAFIYVPAGYVSGALLPMSSATHENQTVDSFGLTAGTYRWTWGSVSGGTFDFFELQILSGQAVSAPGSLPFLALGLGALAAVRRRKGSLQDAKSRQAQRHVPSVSHLS